MRMDDRFDVCYIVSNGFAARMITQTNLLGLISDHGLRVALVCPDKNDRNLVKYCSSMNVSLFEFNPVSLFWSNQYFEIRNYLLEDVESNVALLEKYHYTKKKANILKPFSYIKPRFFWAMYKFLKNFHWLRKYIKEYENTQLRSKEAVDLISNINPRILVATYPINTLESMLLKVGNERAGTKTVIHLLSWDNISCKGQFPQLADDYLAWGPIMKQEFIKYYNISKENIHIVGVPHFDIHYLTKQNPKHGNELVKLGLKHDKPYLFFGMSSPRFAPHEIDIVEWLARQLEDNAFGENMQLVVRPHPQNISGSMADFSWIPRLNRIISSRVGIDFPDIEKSCLSWSLNANDMNRMSNLIAGSSVTINSGSTLCIEALIFNKPVIITSFDAQFDLDYWISAKRLVDYPHLKKLCSTNAVSVSNSFSEFSFYILSYLKNPNQNKIDRENSLNMQILDDRKHSTFTKNIVNYFVCQM
jgi:hypothetical protein